MVHKKIQKVDGSRYMSIEGCLTLGDREVRLGLGLGLGFRVRVRVRVRVRAA